MGQSMRRTAAAEAPWLSISPNEAGFTSDLEARLDEAITQKRVWNLHGVIIVRKGRLVLERYFEGDDNARGSGVNGTSYYVGCTLATPVSGLRFGSAFDYLDIAGTSGETANQTAQSGSVDTSDEAAGPASEPAATLAPEPAGNGAEGEAYGEGSGSVE